MRSAGGWQPAGAVALSASLWGLWWLPLRVRDVVWHQDAGTETMWSARGEQAMWRGLLLSRGVPEYALWAIPAGALPARWRASSATGWTSCASQNR